MTVVSVVHESPDRVLNGANALRTTRLAGQRLIACNQPSEDGFIVRMRFLVVHDCAPALAAIAQSISVTVS